MRARWELHLRRDSGDRWSLQTRGIQDELERSLRTREVPVWTKMAVCLARSCSRSCIKTAGGVKLFSMHVLKAQHMCSVRRVPSIPALADCTPHGVAECLRVLSECLPKPEAISEKLAASGQSRADRHGRLLPGYSIPKEAQAALDRAALAARLQSLRDSNRQTRRFTRERPRRRMY